MTIEGIELTNLTDYSDREILSWYEIGKLYFESMGDNPWAVAQRERLEEGMDAIFLGALVEGGAMIQQRGVHAPWYPPIVAFNYDDNEKEGKICFVIEKNRILIHSY